MHHLTAIASLVVFLIFNDNNVLRVLGQCPEADNIYSKMEALEEKLNSRISILEKELTETKLELRQYITHDEMKYMVEGQRDQRSIEPEYCCDQPVSFSAFTEQHQHGLGIHQTIMFYSVINNEGQGYSNRTGVFRTPISGTYYFSVVIMSHQDTDIEAELVVNGNGVSMVYAGAVLHSGKWSQGSNVAIYKLVAGDEVWVRTVQNNYVNADTHVYGGQWSSFSGFRIYKN